MIRLFAYTKGGVNRGFEAAKTALVTVGLTPRTEGVFKTEPPQTGEGE